MSVPTQLFKWVEPNVKSQREASYLVINLMDNGDVSFMAQSFPSGKKVPVVAEAVLHQSELPVGVLAALKSAAGIP